MRGGLINHKQGYEITTAQLQTAEGCWSGSSVTKARLGRNSVYELDIAFGPVQITPPIGDRLSFDQLQVALKGHGAIV
jgi:hypothetical protein